MLKELKLTNFGQHESLVVNFTEGMNVIRGANEKGKSTLFSAIAYAFGGSRALPLTLEDTVTWGKPPGSLRVELVFDYAGVEYSLYRAKSGAQMTYVTVDADSRSYSNVVISGQAEVTSAIERIFGVNMATAKLIMLAEQGNLRGSLDTGAVQLIERLSNMALIDQLVLKVQDKLPCGSTKALEQGLQEMQSKFDKPPEDIAGIVQEYEGAIQQAQRTILETEHGIAEINASVEIQQAEKISLVGERARIAQNNNNYIARARNVAELESAIEIAINTVIEDKEPRSLEELYRDHAEQESLHDRQRIYNLFTKRVNNARHGDCAKTTEMMLNAELQIKQVQEVINRSKIAIAGESAKLVTGTCSYCDKDLLSVEQVRGSNKILTERLEALENTVTRSVEELADIQLKYAEARELWDIDKANKAFAQSFPKHVADAGGYPAKMTWLGDPPKAKPPEDFTNLIAKKIDVTRRKGELDSKKKHLHESLEKAKQEFEGLELLDIETADRAIKETTSKLVSLQETLAGLITQRRKAEMERVEFRNKAETIKLRYALEQERYEAGVASIKEREALLAEYAANNDLIKRLRDIRPIVAKKLWASVLNPMSSLLTAQRGEPSTITRDTDKFFINGKPAEAYSGSAKDCLGLAIRIALQKTFTPAVDFLLVDEPAAAASEEREAAMLGMLSSANYGQVIVVTHSSLADTFASNFIQL